MGTYNNVPFYGEMGDAESYFQTRLNSQVWDITDIPKRYKALVTATRMIDRLNFAGDKNTEAQALQFPRGADTTVPADILYACYELAYALLDGVDPELEAQSINVSSEAYSGVRSTYDGDSYLEHVRAGIPCITAWNYLKPYLRDPRHISFSRVY